jgi:hypothetical protein
MTDRTILERNKAVLWARDVITRGDTCFVVTGDKTPNGTLSVTKLNGTEVTTCNTQENPAKLAELARSLAGKELVVSGVPEVVLREFRSEDVTVHDLFEYYKIYVNSTEARMAESVPATELNNWVREVLHKMAGSSLVLDQADTGAGKWTSSHFKPSASVMDKIKSVFKG